MTTDNDHFTQSLFNERGTTHPLELMHKAQDDSRKVGFDFKEIDLVMEKIDEEVGELKEAYENRHSDKRAFEDELGDCFFTLVNLCRHADVDMNRILDRNCVKYLLRCQYIEKELSSKNWSDLELSEIYSLWKNAKAYVAEQEAILCK